MANNTEKSFNKTKRDTVNSIPNDLFDKKNNQQVKIYLLQKQIEKNPIDIIQVVKQMIKTNN